jgi:hypothetical protein
VRVGDRGSHQIHINIKNMTEQTSDAVIQLLLNIIEKQKQQIKFNFDELTDLQIALSQKQREIDELKGVKSESIR